MHQAAFDFVRAALDLLEHPPTRVLEVGSRNVNGSVRGLFTAETYLGIDLNAGDGVDVVADGLTYQPTFAPDCIVCCEVLEHTDQAPALVAHLLRLLAPGGALILTAAGPGRPEHSGDTGKELPGWEFYRNVPVDLLARWIEDPQVGARIATLRVLEAPEVHDVYAVAIIEEADADRLH